MRLYEIYESLFCPTRYKIKKEIEYNLSRLEKLASPNHRPSRTDPAEENIHAAFNKLIGQLREAAPKLNVLVSSYGQRYRQAQKEYISSKRKKS